MDNRKIIVMKFGGTSVQDSGSIRNVIRIVRENPERKVVVVSAIAEATNSLERAARLAADKKDKEANAVIEELVNRHHSLINELVTDKKLKGEAAEKIMNYHVKISELITGLAILNELTLRTLDAFRVFGELMSSAVIFHAMRNEGIDTVLVNSAGVIITDNEFSRAYPNFELTGKNIETKIIPLLNENKTVLVQGFIASTEDGLPTTMGRESSDFSAAIYGTLTGADEIQIWTDVDGVLTADPNVIKNTYKLNEISFQEMEELSNFGAKVLHKNSVKPALKKNIPIKVLNSKNQKSTGTVINSNLNFHNQVKSITYKKNIIVLQLKPKETLNLYVFWEMMLNILIKHKPQIDILVSSNNAIIIVIAENNYTKIHYEDLKDEFEEISDYKLIKDKVLITLVGSDLNAIDNFEQRIFISIPNIRAEAVVFGYNRHSFSLLLDVNKFETAMKNLHREFFEIHEGSTKLFEKARIHEPIATEN
jgi:aspartate kinase